MASISTKKGQPAPPGLLRYVNELEKAALAKCDPPSLVKAPPEKPERKPREPSKPVSDKWVGYILGPAALIALPFSPHVACCILAGWMLAGLSARLTKAASAAEQKPTSPGPEVVFQNYRNQ